jgi:hypothetical protein
MYPKSFPGSAGVQIGIIAGGHMEDPAKDHSGNQRVVSPMEHGSGVQLNHLNFSPMSHSPTQHSQQCFPGVMDPGTLVYVLKNTGQNQVTIIGQANDLHNSSNRTPGNIDLLSNWSQLFKMTTGVSTPPSIEEKEENGAKIRKIKEKGQMHSHSLLKGLPTHGALFDMTGFRIPGMPNIPTAKQKGQQMMTNDMMDQLQGTIGNIGGMFQGLMNGGGMGGFGGRGGGGGGSGGAGAGVGGAAVSGNFSVSYAPNGVADPGTVDVSLNDVKANLTPQMQDAVSSLSYLIQNYDVSNGVAFVTDNQVHEETYLKNAQDLLCQVTCIDDLMYVLQRLQWDNSLHGLDKLLNIEQEIETAWGTALQTVYANGHIHIEYSNTAANNLSTFANNLTDSNTSMGLGFSPPTPTGSSGGGGGGGGGGKGSGMGNMFGSGASKIMEMMQRLPQGGESEVKKMTEKLSGGMDQQKLMQIVKSTVDGGNPLEIIKQIGGIG